MNRLANALPIFIAVCSLLLSLAICIEANGELFHAGDEEYPARDAAEAILAGASISSEGVAKILMITSEELLTERNRIRTLGALANSTGLFLTFLSAIQCLLLVRGNKRSASKTTHHTDE